MPENVTVSRESIQVPYRRFLSDSAAGFSLILFALAAFYYPILAPHALKDSLPAVSAGNNVKIFILVLSFLLATPIGFAVNAMSWLFFGQVMAYVERMCAYLGSDRSWFFPISDIVNSRASGWIRQDYNRGRLPFDQTASMIRELVDMPHLARVCPETQVRGLAYFLRNLSFFASLAAIARLAADQNNAKYDVWLLTSALAVGLTIRWEFIANMKALSKWLFGAIGGSIIIVSCYSLRYSAVALELALCALAMVLLAGLVSYYNGCDVLLHWRVAAMALVSAPNSVAVADEEHIVKISAEMLRVATERQNV